MTIGRLSAGTSLIAAACGIGVGFAMRGFGSGIISNPSDSGGGIDIAVGFMISGAGYLVIGVSVLLAAVTLVILAITELVRWIRTKRNDRSGALNAGDQQNDSPNAEGDSKLLAMFEDD